MATSGGGWNPVDGVRDVIDTVGGTLSYWSDPWTNTFTALRDASKSLATELLPALTTATLPDLSADWFIAAYRIAFAAALFVAVVLLIPQVIRTARGAQSGRELASSMGLFFPLFLLGAMFGPAAGLLLVRFFHALSTDLGVWGITGSAQRVTDAFTTMLDEADPVGIAGGVPIAVLFMLLMLLGLVLVLCILVVQLVTLYFTGVLVPLGLVWVIDARQRTFGLRLIGLWFGILAAHPVLFFMLGFAFTLMGSSVDTFGNNLGLRSLVQLLVAVAAMFIAGLSPLLLMKFAPILPGGSGGTAGAAVSVPSWGRGARGRAPSVSARTPTTAARARRPSRRASTPSRTTTSTRPVLVGRRCPGGSADRPPPAPAARPGPRRRRP